MVQNTQKFHPKCAKKDSTLDGSVIKHPVFHFGGAKPKIFGGAKYTLQFFSYLFIFNAFLLLSFFNHPKILKIDDCYSKS